MPNWFTSPGATIRDCLDEREIRTERFAEAIGQTLEFTEKLLRGEVELTPPIADTLAQVLGSTPGFWLRREANYRNDKARLEALDAATKDPHTSI